MKTSGPLPSRREFISRSIGAAALAIPFVHSAAAKADATALPKRLDDVNTTDIRDAIRLGCRTMESVFNADDPLGAAFFGAAMNPPKLSFSAHHSESHVPGRHLNALLSAEDAAGITLNEKAVEKHADAAFFSYSGPFALPMNRAKLDGPPVNFCPHNLREGFHALFALMRYRKNERAREAAERSIAEIGELWDPEDGWKLDRFAAKNIRFQQCQGFVHGEARMLGPLVKYYRATEYEPALELALALKDKLADEIYTADGDFDAKRFSTTHCHSVTCVLSSLAQCAELLDDSALLNRVKAFYDNGLQKMRDALGWSPESVARGTDDGEMNNTGDILETALILGRYDTEYYHDAERILRGHILPSQLRDVSWAKDSANPDGVDALRDVPNRLRGAFGFPAPYSHLAPNAVRRGINFNLDIVGGTVGSLCEAYRAVRQALTGAFTVASPLVMVNLLFDHENDDVAVKSPYTHDALTIRLKKPYRLFVRMPPWVDRKQTTVTGEAAKYSWLAASYLFFEKQPAGTQVRIKFPLPEEEITLGAPHPKPIRVRLRGDAVAAMENFGASLTFFPDLQE